jgi:hypothetical protein
VFQSALTAPTETVDVALRRDPAVRGARTAEPARTGPRATLRASAVPARRARGDGSITVPPPQKRVRPSAVPLPEARASGLHERTVPGTDSVKAASAAGSGTVTATYAPEAADKGTKIVFIQVMRELLDGAPAKPSASNASFSYQDADTTNNFYHVDYVSGEKDPYYNGDDPQDHGTQGNAAATPKVSATMDDAPNYNDGTFPAGKSKIRYEFRDAAFSATGPDAGTYYSYVDWTYDKQKGTAAKTTIGAAGRGNPGANFVGAVKLWNSNHGFKMP